MYYIVEQKTTAINFIKLDLDEKKKSLDRNEELWKSALLCSIMGMFGLRFKKKVLKNCGISENLYPLYEMGFLVDQGMEQSDSFLWVRHERWAQEFLTLIYNERKSIFEISYDAPGVYVK